MTRTACGAARRDGRELGRKITSGKKTAPTRPHPPSGRHATR